MASRTSTLNPYAAAYVPLPRRGTDNETQIATVEKAPRYLTSSQSFKETKQNQISELDEAFHDLKVQVPEKGQGMTEQQFEDVERAMDLEYLSGAFPHLSGLSLEDVYKLNGEELDLTIEMLEYLELPADFSPRLVTPDENEPPAEFVNEVLSGEASGSSSLAPPTV